MVTALDPGEERVRGIEAGADDFLSKPINTAELLAQVRSLLRICEPHETVRRQAAELADRNKTLADRVEAQVAEMQRLDRLRRFLPRQLAQAISADGMRLLEPHRRRVTVVFVDLRGFTSFAESAEPEERAVRMAVAMRSAALGLRKEWTRLGWELGLGIGITSGYATVGQLVETVSVGELTLKGFRRPVPAHDIVRMRS